MRLRFLMGYDGPFRLWVDAKPVYCDLTGANPCFADQGEKRISLGRGRHRITVAMDVDEGPGVGFHAPFHPRRRPSGAAREKSLRRAQLQDLDTTPWIIEPIFSAKAAVQH